MTALPSFFNKLALIKQIPIFAGLNWFELNRIVRRVELVEFSKGNVVCHQGDPADAFYALISGRIYSYALNPAGEKEEIDFILRGMHFGIISALTGECHSHTYEAINDSVIIKIPKDDFANLLKGIPKLAIALSQNLSQRIRKQATGTRSTQECTIIAVYAPIKGSGSSTYAANLALTLKSQTDKKVLLLSLSSNISDPLISLTNIVHDHQKILGSIIKDKLSVDILAAKFDPADQGILSRISQLVSAPVNDYNYIVFDLPNQMDNIVFKALVQSDTIHLVTMEREYDLEIARTVIDELSLQLKDKFQADKLQVIISGAIKDNDLKAEEIKKILNYDVFVKLPLLKPEEFETQDVFDGFSITKIDPSSQYTAVLQRLSRQISGSLIGLVLGGGAALGLAHVGVINILEKEKIPIDVVVGSSMGALIAGLWCVGNDSEQLEKYAREFESKSGMLKLLDPPLGRRRLIFAFLIFIILLFLHYYVLSVFFLLLSIVFSFIPISGIVNGNAIKIWLSEKLSDKKFHHTKIPLKIVAYDLHRRHEIVIDDGSLVEAIAKSIAIPGVIKPVMENGQMIIDGGVLNPLPTNVLVNMGVKKIIAINVLQSPHEVVWGQEKETEDISKQMLISFNKHPLQYMKFRLGMMLGRAVSPNIADIIVRTLQASEYILAESSGKQADVLIHPDLKGINWFELYEVDRLIKRGQEATLKNLPAIKALVKR